MPASGQFLKVVYDGGSRPLPPGLSGDSFACVFGATTSQTEHMLIKRGIKGPCWLSVSGAAPPASAVSWCRYEAVTSGRKAISVLQPGAGGAPLPPAPPLKVMSLRVQTVISDDKAKAHHVVLASAIVHGAAAAALPAARRPPARLLSPAPSPLLRAQRAALAPSPAPPSTPQPPAARRRHLPRLVGPDRRAVRAPAPGRARRRRPLLFLGPSQIGRPDLAVGPQGQAGGGQGPRARRARGQRARAAAVPRRQDPRRGPGRVARAACAYRFPCIPARCMHFPLHPCAACMFPALFASRGLVSTSAAAGCARMQPDPSKNIPSACKPSLPPRPSAPLLPRR